MVGHRYYVTYDAKLNTWSVVEKNGFSPRDKSVSCGWNIDPEKRTYSTIAYGECAGDALNVSQDRILTYIQEHKNPLTTLQEVVAGKAAFRSYDEIIHEMCRAIILQQEQINEKSNT